MSQNYKNIWKCPYCNLEGETVWNKTSYYELTEHLKRYHLIQASQDIIDNSKKSNREELTNMNWGFYNTHVKSVEIPNINCNHLNRKHLEYPMIIITKCLDCDETIDEWCI